jgi:signal transduction histidine kinase
VYLRSIERWIALVRLAALPFVIAIVSVADNYPPGYDTAAWIVTAVFAVGSIVFFAITRRPIRDEHDVRLSIAGQVFDTAVIVAYVLVFSFERGVPVGQFMYVAVVAGCVRFAIVGGLVVVAASVPVIAYFAKLRADRFHARYSWELIVLQTGIELLIALIVGELVRRLNAATEASVQAYEAEHDTVEELRRLSAMRADFVSLVSHELRSPMAAVIGSARTLQRRWPELSPEHRDSFLALIADETNRLARLVSDVFDTSRIDSGTFGYTFSDVDVAVLVRDAVSTATASQGDVEVVATVASGLPSVRGDGVRLRQVLANLLENAIKYSPGDAPVEVGATAEDGTVSVAVTDHGRGISAENQSVIFEKFGRVRGPDAPQGTGLGLFIARSIAEAHGGSLQVRSRLGQGSTFTLTLPVSRSAGNNGG